MASASAALSLLATCVAGPVGASEPLNWVALGDSYSAGVGGPGQSTQPCLREPEASYSGQAREMLRARGYSFEYLLGACAGAVTDDVFAGQVALVGDADVVTMTIGGNDAGFASAVLACLGVGPCPSSDEVDWDRIYRSLVSTYVSVRQAMPADGDLLVLTYPVFYARTTSWEDDKCPSEHVVKFAADRLNEAAVRMGDTIYLAVQEANKRLAAAGLPGNTHFVDVRPAVEEVWLDGKFRRTAYDGTGLCSTVGNSLQSINGLVTGTGDQTTDVYHPTQLGYWRMAAGLKNAMERVLGAPPSRPQPDPDPEPEPRPQEPEPPSAPRFSDTEGNVHAAAIEALAAAGVARGRADGSFDPNGLVLRGQMASFLARALRLPAGPPSAFADVGGTTHEAAVSAVSQAGIASGYSDGTFKPDLAVTRGQMATFLARALALSPVAPSFPDVNGTAHAGNIGAVARAGITSGFADGTYGPNRAVTRGQMASFLFRALKLIDMPPEPSPTAVDLYSNYGQASAGHAMCRGNPGRPESMPGGRVEQSFTAPAEALSVTRATVQIDPDPTVVATATLLVNGQPRAVTSAAATGDTRFDFAPVGVAAGDLVTLRLDFTANFGKIITVYSAGSPGGTLETFNSCPDGAPSFTTSSTGLRAVITGTAS